MFEQIQKNAAPREIGRRLVRAVAGTRQNNHA
jgi:hypothetical protein